MTTEEQVIQNIIQSYDEHLIDLDFKIEIPRFIRIDQFTSTQLKLLENLIKNKEELFLEIDVFDEISQKTFALEKDEINEILVNKPHKYSIQTIHFNFAYAMIWISLTFQDQITELTDTISKSNRINKKNISVAIIVSLMCLTTFFITFGGIPELLSFAIFAAGFLSIGYIYDKIKERIIYKSRKKQNELKFYINHDLTQHLADFANIKLNLDDVDPQ